MADKKKQTNAGVTELADGDLDIVGGEGGPGAIDAFRLSGWGDVGKTNPADLKQKPQLINDDVAGLLPTDPGNLKK